MQYETILQAIKDFLAINYGESCDYEPESEEYIEEYPYCYNIEELAAYIQKHLSTQE